MSDRLGPLSFGKRDELVFLGREIGEQRDYSDEVAMIIDEEVRAIVDRAYDRATEVLTSHRDRLDNLAEKLIAEETVDTQEFEKLFDDLPPKPERQAGIPRVIAPGTDGGASSGPPLRLRTRRRSRPEPADVPAPPGGPERVRPSIAPPGPVRLPAVGRAPALGSTGDVPPPGDPMTDLPSAPIDPAVEAALVASAVARAEALLEFARIPSMSSLPGACRAHGRRGRVGRGTPAAGGRHRRRGRADRLHPIVYGRIHEAPGAPTILVYCHYDVQPVDPIELWETAPFEPFLRDGRFVGRGVADDKGQLVMHLAAIEALRAVGRAPAVNLTFVFEGEEEYGSDSLYAWIEANRDRLAADVALISDTGYFEGNLPAITVGLRGIMYAQIDVELSPVDLHSGMYGGTRREPGQRPRDDHRVAQGSGRTGADPRVLRRRRGPHRH